MVVVCGILKKRIEYDAIIDNSISSGNYVIDEIPFSCLIDRDDIKVNDQFEIETLELICEVSGNEMNFAKHQETDKKIAFRYEEKDVIKVCIKKLDK